MRQRKLKDLDERLERFGAYRMTDARGMNGKWSYVFGRKADLFLEIGSGKGLFLMSCSEAHPERDHIGIECQQSVLVRALEKACAAERNNIVFVDDKVYDIRDYFADNELTGIYLNFSDPWPKDRHAKRRLTHRDRLKSYAAVLKDGGAIEIKTDNDDLFAFTLVEIGLCGLDIEEMTKDLHGTGIAGETFLTEYESKFIERGKNINYVKVRVSKE